MQSYRCLIEKRIDVKRSPRVMQMKGIFDVPPTEKSELKWQVDMPLDEKDWNIGLILGPSGCGKTTIAGHLWPDSLNKEFSWSENACILDDFPESMSIKEITKLLQEVGFSTPTSWLRPCRVLSTGEKFRVSMARTLVETKGLAVIDEYTSTVDRTVAKIASICVSKAVRKHSRKLIAISCHYDILDWLQPDWVYEPIVNIFKWRRLWRFPQIILSVSRVHHQAWEIFKQHHYLTGSHINGAICFVAFWEDVPVAFQSIINLPGKTKNRRKGHRIVVLPDFQGVGIGTALRNHIGSILKANGLELISRSGVPGIVLSSLKDSNWRVTELFKHQAGKYKNKRFVAFNKSISSSRLTSSFRYVGPAYPDFKIAKEMVYPSCR